MEFFFYVTEPSVEPGKMYIQEVLIYFDDTFESSCVGLEKNRVIKSEQFSALMNFKKRHDIIYKDFNNLVMQGIRGGAKEDGIERFEFENCDFEEMTELFQRIEVWRSPVDYGLKYTGEEEDLEKLFPVSVLGMMRLTDLAFPDPPSQNMKQE